MKTESALAFVVLHRLAVLLGLLALVSSQGLAAAELAGTKARVLGLDGEYLAVAEVKIAAPDAWRAAYPETFKRLVRVVRKHGAAAVAAARPVVALTVTALPNAAAGAALSRAESFRLEVDAATREIRLLAVTPAGAVQGLNRLARELQSNGGQVRSGTLIDWPVHATRAAHLVTRAVSMQMLQRAIDELTLSGMNTVILQLADGFKLDSTAVEPRADALSKAQLVAIVEYARGSGVRVIPEIKLLSHQEKFFGTRFQELLFNQRTYDPRVPAVYDLAFEYVDEVIGLISPDAIHIGHDEIRGVKRGMPRKIFKAGEKPLPPELFVQDVLRVYKALHGRGIQVWMWGDMLVWPGEFPTMHPRHLHGDEAYAAIRAEIPREIVICDWHYVDEQAEFPTLTTFAAEGFQVLGATWKQEAAIRNMSAFAAANPAGVQGMIATTWYHLQRREWDVMQRILRTSGDAFWYGQ